MSTGLNIALAAEFELCEKLAEALEQSELAVEKLAAVEIYPFSEEQGVRFNNKSVAQIAPAEVDWSEFNYVLFAGDTAQVAQIAAAAQSDCVIIDLKGVLAALGDVPVVVPTVNESELVNLRQRNIACLPDPQITQLALAIAPFVQENNLTQVALTSLLPASYQNGETVEKLAGQTAQLLNGIPLDDDQQRLAFDVFPAPANTNLAAQLQRIYPQLNNVIVQQIQVPVFYGLAQMASLIGDYELVSEPAIEQWQSNALIDYQPASTITPVTNGEAEAGELPRLHISNLAALENGVQFWSVADEQRFNIALMGVKLLEAVYQNGY